MSQLSRMNNIKYDDNEDDDEDEREHSDIFNDNNEEFIEFKNNVKVWLALDDDIATLQNAIKERRNKKVELTSKITEFMGKFDINDLNTGTGKLKYSKSTQTKPLNKQFLSSRLGDFFKDFSKGEKAAMFILENREKTEVMRLRRIKTKKEMNL